MVAVFEWRSFCICGRATVIRLCGHLRKSFDGVSLKFMVDATDDVGYSPDGDTNLCSAGQTCYPQRILYRECCFITITTIIPSSVVCHVPLIKQRLISVKPHISNQSDFNSHLCQLKKSFSVSLLSHQLNSTKRRFENDYTNARLPPSPAQGIKHSSSFTKAAQGQMNHDDIKIDIDLDV